MESFTYVIRSYDRENYSLNNLSDCYIKLNGLDPKIRLFKCEVISFVTYIGYNYNNDTIDQSLQLCVDNEFFISSSYRGESISGMKVIASVTTNIDAYMTYRGAHFIIPNFNNKTFHFKEFINGNTPPNNRAAYSHNNGNWYLTLKLTPLHDKYPERQISNHPFSCYINSANRINGNIDNCEIIMPYINTQYKSFMVNVKDFILNGKSITGTIQVATSISLIAYDLAENGYQTGNKKLQTLINIPRAGSNNDFCHCDNGSNFICNNFSNKLIRFKIITQNDVLLSQSHGSMAFNSGETSNWSVHMLIYPFI